MHVAPAVSLKYPGEHVEHTLPVLEAVHVEYHAQLATTVPRQALTVVVATATVVHIVTGDPEVATFGRGVHAEQAPALR